MPPKPTTLDITQMTEFLREQQKLATVMKEAASSLEKVTTTKTGAMRDFTA